MMQCQAQSGSNRAPLHRTSRVGQTLCFGPPEWHHELGIFGQSWSALLPSASSARKWDGSSFYICQLFSCGFKIVSGVPLLSRFRLVNMMFPSGLTSHISTLRPSVFLRASTHVHACCLWWHTKNKSALRSHLSFSPGFILDCEIQGFFYPCEKNLPSLRVDGNGSSGVAPDASFFFSPPYLCHNKNIQRLCKLGPSARLWEFLVTRAKVGRGFISVLGSKQLLWISSHICIIAFIQREIFQVQKPVVNTMIIQQLNIIFPLVPPPSHKKH